MNQELARAALVFLERTTISPREINTFNAVYRALAEKANPIKKVKPPKDGLDRAPASK